MIVVVQDFVFCGVSHFVFFAPLCIAVYVINSERMKIFPGVEIFYCKKGKRNFYGAPLRYAQACGSEEV